MSIVAGRRTTPRALISALAAVAVVVLMPLQAEASFSRTVSGSVSASSGTLAAPSGTGITKTCVILALGGAKLNASWTASPSTYATGYSITVLKNGVVDSTNAVAGRATTAVTLPITYANDYTYSIRTVFQNWTSTPVAAPATINCGFLGA